MGLAQAPRCQQDRNGSILGRSLFSQAYTVRFADGEWETFGLILPALVAQMDVP
jgi:hypothetical protein